MKQKLPAILVLLVMVLVGAMYWVDLSYYTDAAGFVTRGPVWARYCVVALPVLMAVLGVRTVGPHGVAALRVKNTGLGGVFILAALAAAVWGIGLLASSAVAPMDLFGLALGVFALWNCAWMFLAALQLVQQKVPSPTRSAIWGVVAAIPYCFVTIQRILIKPSSLYRVGPVVHSLAPMFALLWFAMLLRSFYIALPRRRVRWLYFLGVMAFLFCTCLELPLTVHNAMFAGAQWQNVLESVFLGIAGLVAGCVSVALAGANGADVQKK